ncbi:MAG TPA: MoxR family ATPase [Solirubrobacteraceae bacterium]
MAAIRAAVGTVVVGKDEVVDRLLVAVLCRGHALLEDVPGVGKTLLARSLATALGCDFNRVQFTPDVMPSDVTGSSVFNQRSGEFEFRPGPIFTQILLADEINRATPRAQSALLEAMEERQVTVDGETRRLPEPFLVLATQNPIELEGTFPLPEAQLDRFLLRIAPGYPSREEEDLMLRRFEHEDPFVRLSAVASAQDIVALQEQRAQVTVSEPVRGYLLDVVRATRTDQRVMLGGSPRAALSLHRAVQARALIEGRAFATPDDVKALAADVLSHRLVLAGTARLRAQTPAGVVGDVMDSVAVPVEDELVA